MAEVETDIADELLVRKTLSGERIAFDHLVQRHFGSTYAVAYARLGQRETAEDLAQEVFLRAYLSLGQLRNPATFAAWVHQLARNLAIDWIRRGQRRGRLAAMVPMEESMQELPDENAQDARAKMSGNEEADAVRTALAELSPDARELVLLHFTEELSQREIARRLGVDPATVRRRLEKSTAALQGRLASAVQRSLQPLQPRRAATVHAIALVTAASALSGRAKAALVEEAARTAVKATASFAANKGSVAATTGLSSLLQTTTTIMTTGAKTMGIGKTMAAGVALVGLALGVHYYKQSNEAPGTNTSKQPATANTTASGNVFQSIEDYEFGKLVQAEIPFGKSLRVKYPANAFGRTDGYFTANQDGTLSVEFAMNGRKVTALLGKPVPGAPKVPLDFHVSYGVPAGPQAGQNATAYMEAVSIQKTPNGLNLRMETGTNAEFVAKCAGLEQAARERKISHDQLEQQELQIAKEMDFLPKDSDLRARTLAMADTTQQQ